MRPHHDGHPLVNFTIPELNISLNTNQRTSQKVTFSLGAIGVGRRRVPGLYLNGDTRIHKNPTSSNRISLKYADKIYLTLKQITKTLCRRNFLFPI